MAVDLDAGTLLHAGAIAGTSVVGWLVKLLFDRLHEEKSDRVKGEGEVWKAIDDIREDGREFERSLSARLATLITKDDLTKEMDRLLGFLQLRGGKGQG